MNQAISTKYGLIVGGLLTLFMWVSAFVFSGNDLSKASFVGFLTMAISFAFLFIGVKKYRELNDGVLDFKTGLRVALGIALIASICYVVSWMIYYQFYGQEFVADYQQRYLESLQASGMNDLELGEQRLQLEVMTEKYSNPMFRIGITFMEVIPMGIIFSFFSALILRK